MHKHQSIRILLYSIASTFIAFPVLAKDLPVSCVSKENQRLVDAQKPFPPNSYYVDIVNNCGECAHISTNTKKTGTTQTSQEHSKTSRQVRNEQIE